MASTSAAMRGGVYDLSTEIGNYTFREPFQAGWIAAATALYNSQTRRLTDSFHEPVQIARHGGERGCQLIEKKSADQANET